jgi:hypothetical protein
MGTIDFWFCMKCILFVCLGFNIRSQKIENHIFNKNDLYIAKQKKGYLDENCLDERT